MAALQTDEMLCQEANAIHGDGKVATGEAAKNLYQALNDLKSAALCLSGGGIRSAAFALGVIQALAMHPRPSTDRHAAKAESSLLAKFHYLSTVSGGGYTGSWLSAWVTRAGFEVVWRNLVGRPDGPELEPQPIAWLRNYSNYLTPKLGIMSADMWAAMALILRNIILNWLVILPVLCAALLVVKLLAVFVAWASQFDPHSFGLAPFASVIGILSIFVALLFTQTQRPAHRDGKADQYAFLRWSLFPATLSGYAFAVALATPWTHDALYEWPWFSLKGVSIGALGLVAGASVYVLAWLAGFCRWRIWDALRDVARERRWREIPAAFPGVRAWRDVGWDIFAVLVSGAVYGVLVGLGVYLYLQVYGVGIWIFQTAEIMLVVLGVPWAITSQLIAEMIFVGLSSYEKDSDGDREWLGRAAGWYLVTALLWVGLVFLVFLASDVTARLFQDYRAWLASIGSGVITAWLGRSSVTPAKGPATEGKGLSANIVLAIAAPLFAVLLIVMASAALDKVLLGATLIASSAFRVRVTELAFPDWPGGWYLPVGLAIAIAIGAIASYFININRFSLHALYRNRVIRAFLGASHAQERKPNPFTDFDSADNLRVSELWPPKELLGKKVPKGWQPFYVINMALNIVSTKRLAWQERKAESFTVSPLHSGTACGGRLTDPDGSIRAYGAYRPSDAYGDEDGISLGTAVATSGAAASPNMGYHSSPPLAFLMTLFNVRLGWWLGNPEKDDNLVSEGPRWAIAPLVVEMFGLTTDASKYIYLSDGGHFENLGLYEMVRRRCRYIIAIDAGCDKDFAFEDLGNAVRKIALDLGVRITFRGLDALRLRAKQDVEYGNFEPPFHAVGVIDYQTADGGGQLGTILYIKPAFHSQRINNVGVRNYATANPDFPHQSTANQWFSESQFESYRALGFEITDSVLNQVLTSPTCPPNPTLAQIFALLPNTVS